MILQQQNKNNFPGYSRIISLVPSQTELLHYLGLEEQVVGITKFCVHPTDWFINKTRVGGTKTINFEKIHQLLPDLVIANKEENVKEQVEALAEDYDVWMTDVNDLDDALNMIDDIGELTSRQNRAAELADQILGAFDQLQKNLEPASKIATAYFIWKDPYMVAGGGTFINDILSRAGFSNIFSHKSRYPQINLEEIKKRNCELILLSSEPYPFKDKHLEEMTKLFPGVKVALADGEMFSWYGSRLLKSADYMAGLVKRINTLI